jgi:Uma2 family endonuclease
MSTTTAKPEYRLLHGQTWKDYQRALADRDGLGRRYRISYDRGVLEIMPISESHARWQYLLILLVANFAVEKRIPLRGLGPLTCNREDLDRGLEPDACFYVQHEPLVRGRPVDLHSDPPPDLAIEVDVTRPRRDRMGIYAALGIPEIWRYDGTTLTVLLLGEDGAYAAAANSAAFPIMPLAELTRRLATWNATDETTWLREWQAWVRANV